MPVKVTVTRTQAIEHKNSLVASGHVNPQFPVFDAAIKVALDQAPINYGMSQIKAGSMGWTFVFVPHPCLSIPTEDGSIDGKPQLVYTN